MTEYILVMGSDEDPVQWIFVMRAKTAAEIVAAKCYTRNNVGTLAKARYPGTKSKQISIANCATPGIAETGTIYAVTGP